MPYVIILQFSATGRNLDTEDTFLSKDCLEVCTTPIQFSCIHVRVVVTVPSMDVSHVNETCKTVQDYARYLQDIARIGLQDKKDKTLAQKLQ